MPPDSVAQVNVARLQGVGPKLEKKLRKLGINKVQDLFFHLPIRYIDKTRISPIGALQPSTYVLIEGEIRASDVVYGRRRSLVCRIQDATGTTTLRFFHFNRAQQERLQSGVRLRCFGEVRKGQSGLEFYHPEYHTIEGLTHPPLDTTLTPIYPTTEGLTQYRIRDLCEQAMQYIGIDSIPDVLTGNQASEFSLDEALRFVHRPPIGAAIELLEKGIHPAQQRLAFEELIAHHLALLRLRQRAQLRSAPRLRFDKTAEKKFLSSLGFSLTNAQAQVNKVICRDIRGSVPMLRLIQGDVGSGKTVVAALAAIQAITNGHQVALMAPTEILAEQHLRNFEKWLLPMNIDVAWLTGKLKGKARARQLEIIANGSAKMIIGTHALFQGDVVFDRLGLTIIDEQHRFGVHQRLALRKKGAAEKDLDDDSSSLPHQLIMTATPIPRSLAMTAYADLDYSIIDELPAGRKPVETSVVSSYRRNDVIQRVRNACESGRQAYWVCTMIEESDILEAEAAEVITRELQLVLPELSIGIIHGRQKAHEKTTIMEQFESRQINLLVATTVIEVGVDVPNASLMIIENAERLGLSQLHQLRGRVGRGSEQSHCVLLYGSQISKNGKERLKIMRETNNGFAIADKDLLLRGPGEVLGTRQAGDMQFRVADLQRDAHLIPIIKDTAHAILRNNPTGAETIIARWLGDNHHCVQA